MKPCIIFIELGSHGIRFPDIVYNDILNPLDFPLLSCSVSISAPPSINIFPLDQALSLLVISTNNFSSELKADWFLSILMPISTSSSTVVSSYFKVNCNLSRLLVCKLPGVLLVEAYNAAPIATEVIGSMLVFNLTFNSLFNLFLKVWDNVGPPTNRIISRSTVFRLFLSISFLVISIALLKIGETADS